MKRMLFLSCSMLGFAYTTSAFAESNFVTIEENNGQKTSYLLEDAPVISYAGDSLIVSGSVNVSYLLSGVNNYHFSEIDETAVAKVCSNEVRISYSNNQNVQVEGLDSNIAVNLYSTNGVLISSQKASADGFVSVTLPDAKGVYLLTINNKSYKFLKK